MFTSSVFKRWAPYIYIVLLASVFVLSASFNLSLTGDDYLGLYRYEESIQNGINPIRYWFTDYGPQDTFTFLIHSVFGFTPQVYYLFSFVFRMFASLSFIPLIIYFTKDKRAAFVSAFFFAIGTTGLETTDWSFNLPSYIAIGTLNFFLIHYYRLRKQFSFTRLCTSLFLFVLTITVQPIRLAFLPLALVTTELIALFFLRKHILETLFRIGVFLTTFVLLLKITGIGTTASGVTGSNGASTTVQMYLDGVKKAVDTGENSILLTPITQLGGIVIPDTFISPQFNTYSNTKTVILLMVPLLIFACSLLLISKSIFKTMTVRHVIIGVVVSLIWTVYAFYTLRISPQYPVQIRELILSLLGGCFAIVFLLLLISFYKKQKSFFITLLSLCIIVISYGVAWVRSPGLMNPSVGRYLIVSLAGLALLLGILYAKTSYKRVFIVLIIIPLFLIHAKMSQKYLYDLSSSRSIDRTEKIRNALVLDATTDQNNTPSIYYFQADNEKILHHTIMFGFPMFIHYYKGAKNPWNIAYTTSWREVYDAYITGDSLRRFGSISPIAPINIEHIHGYKIESGELRDITAEVREKLLRESQLVIQ